MQQNPYPEDPTYRQPAEPYHSTPQYPQQVQSTNPPYQGQQGQPIPAQYQYEAIQQQRPPNSTISEESPLKYAIGKLIDFIRWFIVALELLFLVRFVLELIGADPNNIFAQFLYNFTGFFLYPFLGIVPNTHIGKNGAFIDWSTLIGMAIYGILFWILRLFLRITISRPEEPIE